MPLKLLTTVCSVFFLSISGIKAQTPFLPSQITGLQLWLTGDSVDITTPPQIDKCYDLSSSQNHAVADVNAKPLSVNSILNGHKLMRFDGIDDLLDFNLISDMRTVFWVLKEDSAATPNLRPLLGNPAGLDFYRGDNKEMWNIYTNNNILNGVTKVNSIQVDGKITDVPTQYSVISLVTTGNVAASRFTKDRANNGRVWHGDLAELIVYNKALTTQEVNEVEQYLKNKYAPPVQLGPDKIVCSLPYTLKAKKSYFKNYKWQDNSTADSLVVNGSGTYSLTVTNIFGEISTDTINIVYDSLPYTVHLGNDTAICNGQSLLLTAGLPHLTYLWSNGSTENSITVTDSDTYSVTVTDCKGNVSKDTIEVNVHPLPAFDLGVDTLVCFNTSYILDPGVLNSWSYSFLWFDGSTDTTHAVTHGGNYSLKVQDNIGCSFSDTIHITMDSLLSDISLGIDTAFCSGNLIGLKKGAANVVSYLWSTGSTDPAIPITTTGQYAVTVASINNCKASDTINISVSGMAPTSDFSFSATCLKNITTFTDLSTPPVGETISSWNWSFGDSFTSTDPSPFHVYADTGKYTVQLKVTTPAGCSAIMTKEITIFARPLMDFATSLLCEDINVAFIGKATTYGYPVSAWSWNFGDPASGTSNVSVSQNPAHLFASGGTYPVQLIGINSKGCSDTLIRNIVLNTAPIADFTFSNACKDDTVAFKDQTVLPSGVTITSSFWNFGNGTSVLLNPGFAFSSNVSYFVQHIITGSNGCKDTVTKKVDVHASPVARFVNTTSCVGGETVFTDQSLISAGSITSWKWTFDNNKFATVKNPVISFSKSGNTVVKQVVVSDFGCKDSITKTIVVYPKPTAQFTVAPDYGNPGQNVKFTNNSVNATTYIWDFDDKSSSTLVNPSHVYKDTGIYHPMLVAVSSYGCKDTIKGKVSILKRFIDVAITGTKADIQNGGGVLLNDYLNVHVDLINKSTADIFTMDLYMETNDGPGIKETWTGKWLKGDVMSYDFKTTPALKEGGHFVCVYVLNPNGVADEVPIDNKLCNALNETEFKVLSPYPNPTEDLVVIPLIIPSKGELQVTIYNSAGRAVKMPYSETTAQGLQFLTIDAQGFNAGLYVCKVELDSKSSIVKFIKK